METTPTTDTDVVVIGGGQAGLATSYWLRRAGIEHVVLDDAEQPGGAWARMWPSLRAFSPAQHSSLPGWMMPQPPGGGFPPREHVAGYLTDYEERYEVPVERPVRVEAVRRDGGRLRVEGRRAGAAPGGGEVPRTPEAAAWSARAVVSATGTWSRPFWPSVPGMRDFGGVQLHSAQYRRPADLPDGRVLVVGGGNTGAQLAAELLETHEVVWATQRPPRLMPPEVDGRVLFDVATARRAALDAGREDDGGVAALGDIVQVPGVREAVAAGHLAAVPMVERLTASGAVWGADAAGGTGRPGPERTRTPGVRPVPRGTIRPSHPVRSSSSRRCCGAPGTGRPWRTCVRSDCVTRTGTCRSPRAR
ncbi:NAD(P)-binding domain-containing protein [Kytococcus sp. Marseille-QA3725]